MMNKMSTIVWFLALTFPSVYAVCVDNDITDGCSHWVDERHCDETNVNHVFMTMNCAKSCGFCESRTCTSNDDFLAPENASLLQCILNGTPCGRKVDPETFSISGTAYLPRQDKTDATLRV